jgi:hypothetical protein
MNIEVKWGYRGRKQYQRYFHTANRIFWGHYVKIKFDPDYLENYRAYWMAYEVRDIGYEEGYANTVEEAVKDVEEKLGLGWKWYDQKDLLPKKVRFYLS